MKPRTFSDLFQQAEKHEDYWLAGAILDFTEGVVREMERQGMTRTELAERLGATPAYVTKILRGKVNFTLGTMVRLARALSAELHVQITGGGSRSVQRTPAGASASTPKRPARETKVAVTAIRPAARVARRSGRKEPAREAE